MKNLMKWLLLTLLIVAMVIPAYAHCEIPCGIYGDSTRIELIREHVKTIQKSMKMIDKLSREKKPDYNQLIRWVNNKDEHAKKIQEIITQYFMFQRIKPAKIADKEAHASYNLKLELLHRMSVSAMKCKQSTDTENPAKLLLDLDRFEGLYFGKHEH